MSVGKYSPTVSCAYSHDQGWWERNGGDSDRGEFGFFNDVDGYDSYGYNKDEVDRAGNTEMDYLTTAEWLADGDVYTYTLFIDVDRDWSVDDDGFPARISTAMV